MRAARPLRVSYIAIFLLIGCGSDYQPRNERIAAIEKKIDEIENSPDEYAANENELNRRAKGNQEMISALRIEISIQQFTYANQVKMIEFEQNQRSDLLRGEIAALTNQIIPLQQSTAEKRQFIASLIGPLPPIVEPIEKEIVQNQKQIDLLQNQRAVLTSQLYLIPEQYSQQLTRQLDSIRAAQMNLISVISSAQTELENIAKEKQRIAAAQKTRQDHLAKLQQDRDRLLQTNQTQ